jgi:purine-binding chemotaxis protein CheW
MNDMQRSNSDGIQRTLKSRARQLAQVQKEEIDQVMLDFLVIKLAGECYGVKVDCVLEVQTLGELTPVPGIPSLWVGLVNLRGRLIAVLDLRADLGLSPFPFKTQSNETKSNRIEPASERKKAELPSPEGQIVFASAAGLEVGLLVDEVLEVRKVSRAEIAAPLSSSAKAHRLLTGTTTDLLSILDVELLLSEARLIVKHETS